MINSLGLSNEEVEELRWIPSAVTIPQKPIFKCDNECSDEVLKYWQCAEVLAERDEEVYTSNLCEKCYRRDREEKGEQPLTNRE